MKNMRDFMGILTIVGLATSLPAVNGIVSKNASNKQKIKKDGKMEKFNTKIDIKSRSEKNAAFRILKACGIPSSAVVVGDENENGGCVIALDSARFPNQVRAALSQMEQAFSQNAGKDEEADNPERLELNTIDDSQ